MKRAVDVEAGAGEDVVVEVGLALVVRSDCLC